MDIYEYIGQRIRSLREGKRLSQENLAKELNISTNTISRWETATYKPSIRDLEKVGKFFNIKLSYFLPEEESNTQASNINALLSATGDLTPRDIEELIEYANFRKMRHILQESKKDK